MKIPDFKEAKKRTKEEIKILKNEYNIPDDMKDYGKNKKYFVKTYGCQMNEHDSEVISAILEDMKFTKTDYYEDADLIILNTCAIRENAHNKTFGMLGRIKHLKQEKTNLMVGLAGCMSQEESVVNEIIDKYKWMDFVFGTHNIHKLPEILKEHTKSKKLEVNVWSNEGNVIEGLPSKRDSKYKAWVNIMYGCDKFCTYCIVPYTRGKQRSRMPEDIIDEVKNLVKDGYKEVTLLGQNVNAYGKDFKEKDYKMENLLEDVAKTGIDRVRFVTSHPWDFTDKMIDVIAKYDNICNYIHLPVQSGSSKILKLMGRRYSKESYLELYKKIRNKLGSDASITTDIIVGFPGEDEKDFEETLSLAEECKFDSAFTFIYSPREGTPAAKMVDNVSKEEKEKRLYRLNDVINKYAKEANDKYVGKTVKVLVESVSEKDNSMLAGYTDTMKLVNVKADKKYIGQIINVKIEDAKTWSLDGTIDE
ncbi:MAG: tRNA (N6-isopentenyl adenosine(37)-C2)-methylthiotransferase MiaB [Tenericutes bacterium]|nr:tRNA (N6-isopentenyl adenosine(37)-C2)-methylthiotransferase MiaB [Mycoplasmatota bacterium]